MIVAVAGIDVHVDGEGGETIVMVHGWPDTYRLWDAQVEHLKAQHRCIRFTLPGFDGAQPRKAYTVDEVTGLIRQVIEQLSPDRKITLMLHDWGCVYGYEFYMRNPGLVARIVSVDIGTGDFGNHAICFTRLRGRSRDFPAGSAACAPARPR